MQLALRARALATVVATTGTLSLAATTTGYTRAAGSFLTDGFAAGMEITPAGFANNSRAVITEVTALAITAKRIVAATSNGVTTYTLAPLTAEVAAGGRSLSVGLPSQASYENAEFQPTAGIPWWREQFIPGPSSQDTVGPGGRLSALPQYAIHVHVPANTKLTAKRYVNKLRVQFAHRTKIALPTSGTLAVRSDTGPYAGELQQSQPGFAVQPFTIPLRLLDSSNVI